MITVVNETPVQAPTPKAIELVTDNSAMMLIEFNAGFVHATLKQRSPLSKETRTYVWDPEALRELSIALCQAADIMEDEQGPKSGRVS